jgi:hypothetical protein
VNDRVIGWLAAALLTVAAVLFALHPSVTYTVTGGFSAYNETADCLSPFNEFTGHYYTVPSSSAGSDNQNQEVASAACGNAIRGRREAAEIFGIAGIAAGVIAYRRRSSRSPQRTTSPPTRRA